MKICYRVKGNDEGTEFGLEEFELKEYRSNEVELVLSSTFLNQSNSLGSPKWFEEGLNCRVFSKDGEFWQEAAVNTRERGLVMLKGDYFIRQMPSYIWRRKIPFIPDKQYMYKYWDAPKEDPKVIINKYDKKYMQYFRKANEMMTEFIVVDGVLCFKIKNYVSVMINNHAEKALATIGLVPTDRAFELKLIDFKSIYSLDEKEDLDEAIKIHEKKGGRINLQDSMVTLNVDNEEMSHVDLSEFRFKEIEKIIKSGFLKELRLLSKRELGVFEFLRESKEEKYINKFEKINYMFKDIESILNNNKEFSDNREDIKRIMNIELKRKILDEFNFI